MVVRANKYDPNIGGHISTYASLAAVTEVGFNHIFRGSYDGEPGDFVYYQGHASPGMYSRAFLEGRLTEQQLLNFRHELRDTPGLSSYPHPWLMPDFWQFPTVSMGLGPLNSIYHARFLRYLENREIIRRTRSQDLCVPGRRRDGRAGIDGRAGPGVARTPRQPDLHRELQSAAAGWAGARQRQHHSGTGRHFPRRRLERDQGRVGRRLGRTVCARYTAACC